MPELAKPYFQSVKEPDTDNGPLVLLLLWNWNILHNQAWNSPSGAIIWNTEYANALQDIPAVQKSCRYYRGRFRLKRGRFGLLYHYFTYPLTQLWTNVKLASQDILVRRSYWSNIQKKFQIIWFRPDRLSEIEKKSCHSNLLYSICMLH